MNKDLIIEQLIQFGLSSREASIYVYLQKPEAESVLEISRALVIARSSVYDDLENLMDLGLVEKSLKYKSQRFKAAPVEMLENIIDEKKKELARLNDAVEDIKQGLKLPMGQTLPAETKLRYYHGQQGIRQLLWNSLSADKEIVGYSTFGRYDVAGETFLRRLYSAMREKGIRDKVITNITSENKNYVERRVKKKNSVSISIRHISKKLFPIVGDTSIYNNVFATIYWQEGELVGFEIENPNFAKMQKTLFEMAWNVALIL